MSKDEKTYTVSFLSDSEAEISIEGRKDIIPDVESTDNEGNSDVSNPSESSDSGEGKDSVQKAVCNLTETNSGESLEGTFHISENENISIIVTGEAVKLIFEKEGEVILKRE